MALSLEIIATSGRARRAVLSLPHGKVNTPIFMPVGTNGTVKGLTPKQVEDIGYKLILSNTYHLGTRPGKEVLAEANGLHKFMNWNNNLLTDSGGFQMVSLLKLAGVTEEGVSFASPVDGTSSLMLTPEMSMEIQNVIGADIMMQLDDVVSAVLPDKERVEEATLRTTRWLDRCIKAHKNPESQNLFGIVQGGLFPDLRLTSLEQLKSRNLPGYAIGGLSGGEAKEDFCAIVELCTRATVGLPAEKPRYLMGVGYPVDMIVAVAYGVDMFDCVYPTRTARFGTAIVPEGLLRLKSKEFENQLDPIQKGCPCYACSRHISRAFMHTVITRTALASRLLTLHNLTFMFRFCEEMQEAIASDTYPAYTRNFLVQHFGSIDKIPAWVSQGLGLVGIDLLFSEEPLKKKPRT